MPAASGEQHLSRERYQVERMSIRNHLRRSLVSLDSLFGVREWLRQDNGADEEHTRFHPSDPFSVAELQHPRPNTVLDIGGNYGQFAEEAFRAFPGVPIYSFEPIPECYERLLLMCEQQPTLHPIQLALGDREGEVDFWLSLYRGSSSIQEMLPTHIEAWPHTEIETKITVPVARLDSVATQLDIKPPVLAKLDIQGHELYAINGA